MRVSIIESDSGYKNYLVAREHGKSTHVFLDGIEQRHCLTADEEGGFVFRSVTNDTGDFVLDEVRENFLQEIVKGVVRIEMMTPNAG